MANQRKTSEELLALQRIEELVRAIAKSILAERLNRYLEDRKFRILYENTGWLTRPELEKKTGFSAGKISGLWKQWEREGLLVKEGKSYRPVV